MRIMYLNFGLFLIVHLVLYYITNQYESWKMHAMVMPITYLYIYVRLCVYFTYNIPTECIKSRKRKNIRAAMATATSLHQLIEHAQ